MKGEDGTGGEKRRKVMEWGKGEDGTGEERREVMEWEDGTGREEKGAATLREVCDVVLLCTLWTEPVETWMDGPLLPALHKLTPVSFPGNL
ncbi:hypothetical protein Pmani_013596 [Petrolisthes manimaculis]|uniref:Uncharacterized protein n=1 Tax=Petrolisthes manimaculis TaxID=1843537 RepID=A0AAE1PVB7_9EUCA|nr:hypothetical protein Pmani_013596 [Petrolisthes manimaculis]